MTDSTDAAAVYADALVWDAHAGFELTHERDLETLAVWRDAGVDYLSVNVGFDVRDWRATVKNIALARRWVDAQPEIDLVGTVAELDQARAAGHMAVTFDIEGMCALEFSAVFPLVTLPARPLEEMLLNFQSSRCSRGRHSNGEIRCRDSQKGSATPSGSAATSCRVTRPQCTED